MGIRFACPHCGRHLNVKAAQAGQKGLCPDCRGSLRIPRTSTIQRRTSDPGWGDIHDDRFSSPDDSHRPVDEGSELLDIDDQVTSEGLQAGEHQSPAPLAPQPVSIPSPPQAPEGDPFLLGRPSPAVELGPDDPFVNTEDRVWYFRSRVLGEQGPLKSPDMRQHLVEGEIQVGSMIWRDDWNRWLPAEEVFSVVAKQAQAMRKQARLQRALERAGGPGVTLPPVKSAGPQRLRNALLLTIVVTVGLAIVGSLVLLLLRVLSPDAG